MPDIIHEFSVKAPQQNVFEMFATPAGLDKWWTKKLGGEPKTGAVYSLDFGPGYEWKAKVTECAPGLAFELQMTDAHEDWLGARSAASSARKDKPARAFSSTTASGQTRTNTGAFRISAGPCTCASCAAVWNTATWCPTKNAWMSNPNA